MSDYTHEPRSDYTHEPRSDYHHGTRSDHRYGIRSDHHNGPRSDYVGNSNYIIELPEKSGYAGYPDTPHSFRSLHQTNRSMAGERRHTSDEKLPFVAKSVHLRECLAEFLGTFVLVGFGLGVNNQVALSDGANGTWMSINFCWGVAVLMGIYCSEGISGAHLNPAVTFTHAVYGRLPWWKVPGYAASQTLGGFLGAAVVFVLDYQQIHKFDPELNSTQSNFATYPSDGISNLTAFYTELLATGMLLLGIYAVTDERNRPAGPIATPFAFALLIMALGMAFGMNTGYAMNPARDFGPRFFTLMAGYGSKVFSLNDTYFWIPIVGPCVGGVIGGGMYQLLVQIHHPPNED